MRPRLPTPMWWFMMSILILMAMTAPKSNARNLSPDEFYLTQAIYFESGVEDYQCKIKLAQTIMNRVNKNSWKDNIKDVVWQRKQFSYTHDGKPETMKQDSVAYKQSFSAAQAVLYGNIQDISRGADHFINHNIADTKVNWFKSMEFVGRCGNHWFYKSKRK